MSGRRHIVLIAGADLDERGAGSDSARRRHGGRVLDERGSVQHEDDFRFHVDGVLMSFPAMFEYYSHDRSFPDRDRLLARGISAPKRQIYFSGLYLFSLLTSGGYDVDLINCYSDETVEMADTISDDTLAVVISTSFIGIREVRALVSRIRGVSHEIPIIVGGRWVRFSHSVFQRRKDPYYASKEVLNDYFFTMDETLGDSVLYIYASGGEETLLKLLERLTSEKPYEDIANLAISSDSGYRFSPEEPETEPEEVLSVDWSLIPVKYTSTTLPVAFSHGCPYRCLFCNFSENNYRKKTWIRIREELRRIREHNRFVRTLWFIDDNFLTSPNHIVELCKIIEEEGFQGTWRSFMRADAINENTVDLLARSRCDMAVLGLESADDGLLASMGKKSKVTRYRAAVRLLAEAGIGAELSFIIGFPGESERSLDALRGFLEDLPSSSSNNAVFFLYLFLFHLLPLSPAFEPEFRDKHGLTGHGRSWRHATMDSAAARENLLRIYACSPSRNLFLNYLDLPPTGSSSRLMDIARLREKLAKARVGGSADFGDIEQLMMKKVLELG